MHPFPSARRPRSRPSYRLPRVVVSALVAAGVAVGSAGCASQTGVRDGGAAPSLSAPTSASPLWPDDAPPSPPVTDGASPAFKGYLPVDKIRAPSGGVAAMSAKTLLTHDPNLGPEVQAAISDCPTHGCPMRAPVHRDLTGDRRDELVVAVDLPGFDRTLLQVYSSSGRTVRPVLSFWGPAGLTGETLGRDLLVTGTGPDGRLTTRFHWNGEVMAAVTPRGGTDADPENNTAPGAGSGTGTRTRTGTGTGTDTTTDTRTAP